MRRFVAVVALAAAVVALAPTGCPGHCGPSHRHYRGKVYYFTCPQHHPVIWCDACGTLRTRGKARVASEWQACRLMPAAEAEDGGK